MSEEQDGSEMDSGSEGEFDDDSDEDSGEIAELPTQHEMKKDLIQAIEEELREQDQLRKENEDLQK